MRQLRSFFQLPARERRFLVKVILLVAAIRLGLWVLPFQTLRRWVDKLSQPPEKLPAGAKSFVAKRAVWAVEATSRFVPQATCLTQALATQLLLSRRGHQTELRFGVAKNDAGKLEAHAWVELDGQIIIGGEDSPTRFTAFPTVEGNGR
jgi:hypothetical protein